MATGTRPFMLDMSRTTTIIGELIQLITDMEEVTTNLGKEGFAYYKAGLFYDDLTLDMCRRIEGALQQANKTRREMEEGLEDNLLLGNEKPGPFTRLRKAFFGSLMHKEVAAHERALREVYDELAHRIQGLSNQDPRALSAKMLRMCQTIRRLQADVDARWAELEARVKNERKGPMFILILNMFVVNFFKFSNQQWFRHWVARMQAFQDRIGERLHREVVHDLSVEEEAPKAPAEEQATSGRGRQTTPRAVDLDDDESGLDERHAWNRRDLDDPRGHAGFDDDRIPTRRRSPFDDDVEDEPKPPRRRGAVEREVDADAPPVAARPFIPKAGPAPADDDAFLLGYDASPSFPEEARRSDDDDEPPRRAPSDAPDVVPRQGDSGAPPALPRREGRMAEPAGPPVLPRREGRMAEPSGPPVVQRREATPPRREAGPPPALPRGSAPTSPPSDPIAPPPRRPLDATPVRKEIPLPPREAPREAPPPEPARSIFDLDEDPRPPLAPPPASEPPAPPRRPASDSPSVRPQIIPRAQRRPDVIQLPKRNDPPPSRRGPQEHDLDVDEP